VIAPRRNVQASAFLAARPHVRVVETEPSTEDGLDLVAVERMVNNHKPVPVLTRPEQILAASHMTRAGLGTREIAARLGVAERTAVRWRVAERRKDDG
jgi:DNA-binding NarL/FixJ family response regulator